MSTPLVSIIVPIYNTSKYLKECIDSFIKQTFIGEIEYIFINDASTDDSLNILEQLLSGQNIIKNYKIINHDTNCGILFTRNEGVKKAQGKYILQIDSDDWIEPAMIEKMVSSAESNDADIVGCDLYEDFITHKKIFTMSFDLSRTELIKELIVGRKIKSYLHCRLVNRQFYLQNAMNTPAGLSLYEDLSISIQLHLNTDKVNYVREPLYHYRQVVSSALTKRITKKSFDSAWKSVNFVRDYIINRGQYDLYKKYIDDMLVNVASWLIFRTEIYNPTLWRKISVYKNFRYLSLPKRLSAYMVMIGLDKINSFYVHLLRGVYIRTKRLIH